MPRYYFHIVDGGAFLDPEGVDLSDTNAALREALRTAGEIIRDGAFKGEMWSLQVVDEQGKVVSTLRFSAGHRADN